MMLDGDLPARRIERRRAARFAFRAELDIEWGSAVLRGSTRDLSASGMFIEAADTLWVGAGFTARLKLDQTVKLDCSVKRVEPGRGMGVSIDLSKAETQQRYQESVSYTHLDVYKRQPQSSVARREVRKRSAEVPLIARASAA